MIALLALACTTNAPEPVRSEPAPAIRDFGGNETGPSRIVLTPITQMFERQRVGPPRVLAKVRPGMPRDEAVALLRATDSTGQPLLSETVAGRELDSLLHVVDPPVRLSLLSDNGRVVAVQVALPFEPATLALADLWGPPRPGPTTEDGQVTHVWSGLEWSARLVPLADGDEHVPAALKGRGVLDITPVSP